jgi:hypothetical protein
VNIGREKSDLLYYTDLNAFVAEEIQPHLEFLEGFTGNLIDGNFDGFDLTDFTYKDLSTYLRSQELESMNLGLMSDFENPTLYHLEEVHAISDIDVRKLEDNKLLITYSALIDAGFDFYIFRPDYLSHYLFEPEGVEIWDSDWNDWYVWAYSEVKNLNLKISIVFSPEEAEVLSIELLDYEAETNPDNL